MASKLILDLKDEGVAELVSSWTDGETYELGGLTIKQVSNDGKIATFDIIELPVEEMPEEPTEGAPPTESDMSESPGGAMKPKGKKSGSPAIMIAFGHK